MDLLMLPRRAVGAALRMMQEATGERVREREKNPAAVALGKLGGKKGGPAGAAKLSAKRRHEIARKAAMARWKPRPPQ